MAPREPGWLIDSQGRKRWPRDSYQQKGGRIIDWLAEGVIKQHRAMGTWLNTLIATGFTIAHVDEWGPMTPTWPPGRRWPKSASGQ